MILFYLILLIIFNIILPTMLCLYRERFIKFIYIDISLILFKKSENVISILYYRNFIAQYISLKTCSIFKQIYMLGVLSQKI